MPISKGTVRRTQIITTYGPGAIVAVDDESFIVRGIDQWDRDVPEFHEPRLERELGIAGFVRPPASEDDPDIPVSRFPAWASCPACHRLAPHKTFTGFGQNECGECAVPLIPSRFIAACANGHIQDFPYDRWVHAGHSKGSGPHELSLRTTGTSASLRSVIISCDCGREVSMDGAFSQRALVQISRCFGRRPWLNEDDQDCDQPLRTLQRGASNVWFAANRSTLSIPPWSDSAFKVINRHWKVLSAVPDAALSATIAGMGLEEETGYSVSDLAEVVNRRKGIGSSPGPVGDSRLRADEYDALLRGAPDDGRRPDFVCLPGELGAVSARYFEGVMLATRLREVRAIESFTRLLPPNPGDDPNRRASLYVTRPSWLPAAEITGEGVFLKLDEQRLLAWVTDDVRSYVADLDGRYRDSLRGHTPTRIITPLLLLTHTLAHVLINQWALDSGYPTASLRERIYADDGQGGLLIYTATSDSAGSLGGVVGQAKPGRLDETIEGAVVAAGWCSSDPICIESPSSGVDSLNTAACHACVLLPEVSCEERNTLLDRVILVGRPDRPELGYFTFDN